MVTNVRVTQKNPGSYAIFIFNLLSPIPWYTYFIEIIEQSFCQDKAFAILAVAVISNTICPPLKQWWHKQCHQVAINNYFVGDDGFESALQFDVVDQATNHCNEFLSALEDNIATESCSDWCTVKDCYLSHTSSHHQIQSIFHCITLSLHCCITSVIHSIQILCDAHNRDCFVQSKYCIKVVLQRFVQIAQSSASAMAILSST